MYAYLNYDFVTGFNACDEILFQVIVEHFSLSIHHEQFRQFKDQLPFSNDVKKINNNVARF